MNREFTSAEQLRYDCYKKYKSALRSFIGYSTTLERLCPLDMMAWRQYQLIYDGMLMLEHYLFSEYMFPEGVSEWKARSLDPQLTPPSTTTGQN
jgi:hypothetical protein